MDSGAAQTSRSAARRNAAGKNAGRTRKAHAPPQVSKLAGGKDANEFITYILDRKAARDHNPPAARRRSSLRRPDHAAGLRNISWLARSFEIHGRRRLCAYALAGGSFRCVRRGDVGRTRRNKLRHALGKRRLFRPAYHPPRSVGSRHRQTIAPPHDGFIRAVENSPRGPVYVREQREAREPISKIRFLASLSNICHGASG